MPSDAYPGSLMYNALRPETAKMVNPAMRREFTIIVEGRTLACQLVSGIEYTLVSALL